MQILVLNAGSSSIKCSLFEMSNEKEIWKGKISWKEEFQEAVFQSSQESQKNVTVSNEAQAFDVILKELPKTDLDAIGHRVVHGGHFFSKPTQITDDVKRKIKSISSFAPLHNDRNLEGIERAQKHFPHVTQFAIFDTAFHQTLPSKAFTYPLPDALLHEGIRRFGFHGINFRYCTERTGIAFNCDVKKLRLILCHLGSGCSLCAVKNGKSIDTTMGMTPLEGMMMATRSGSIDPSILTLLVDEKKKTSEIKHLLNNSSGLLGVSGFSSDMRDIIAKSNSLPRAFLAQEMFIHSLQKHMGMMLASLGGVDAFIFTGGIGENIPLIRKEALSAFSFLPVELDDEKNNEPSHSERAISSEHSKVKVLVIPAAEEYEIAKECSLLLI